LSLLSISSRKHPGCPVTPSDNSDLERASSQPASLAATLVLDLKLSLALFAAVLRMRLQPPVGQELREIVNLVR
jgi:hypothetical protein